MRDDVEHLTLPAPGGHMAGERPRQAVILAGGRGTRMRPWTDSRPKAMIEFHGKPFLEYIVEMLRDQGFERVLLLLGYKAEVIQNYFRDGRRWQLDISYSVSSADNLTVQRLRLAQDRLEPCFLLLYCDNYWPMNMDRMWRRYREAAAPAMVTVYRNSDGYSRDSVIVDSQGLVSVLDRARVTPGLSGVEISYAILTRELLDLLPPGDALVEEALYPRLASRRWLAAYVSDHRYYSVGSPHRLPLTEAFLARTPTVLLDRDGVLNRKPARAHYVGSWSEFEWLPGALEGLRRLRESGYRVVIVSNQAGVARGSLTGEGLGAIHARMRDDAQAAGGRIDAIYVCPHDWDAGCACRKPAPGMLFQAQRDFSLDLTRTPFIGDDPRDAQAADAAGCPFIPVAEGRSLLDAVHSLPAEGCTERIASANPLTTGISS